MKSIRFYKKVNVLDKDFDLKQALIDETIIVIRYGDNELTELNEFAEEINVSFINDIADNCYSILPENSGFSIPKWAEDRCISRIEGFIAWIKIGMEDYNGIDKDQAIEEATKFFNEFPDGKIVIF
jgi:hypothetical protein